MLRHVIVASFVLASCTTPHASHPSSALSETNAQFEVIDEISPPETVADGTKPFVDIGRIIERSGVTSVGLEWATADIVRTTKRFAFSDAEIKDYQLILDPDDYRGVHATILFDIESQEPRLLAEKRGRSHDTTAGHYSDFCKAEDGSLAVQRQIHSASGEFTAIVFAENVQGEDTVGPSEVETRQPFVSEDAESRFRIIVLDESNVAVSGCALHVGQINKIHVSDAGDVFFSDVSFFSDPPATRVYGYFRSGEEIEELFRVDGRFQTLSPKPSPDGSELLFAVDLVNQNWEEHLSLVTFNLERREIARVVSSANRSVLLEYDWIKGGDSVVYRSRNGGFDELVLVELSTQKEHVFASGPRKNFGLSVSPDGEQIAYLTIDGFGRRDFRVYDTTHNVFSEPIVLDDPSAQFAFGPFQRVQWSSSDGVRPFGYLIYPPDFDPQMEYPLLVDIHGGGPGSELYLFGPLTSGVARNSLEWHAWAANGFIVFVPDYRSSGEYGVEILTQRLRDAEFAFVRDPEDVRLGIEAVLRLPYVATEGTVAVGHSAGGARLLRVLASSNIIDAALINESVSPDGLGNLLSSATTWGHNGQFQPILKSAVGAGFKDDQRPYVESILPSLASTQTDILFMSGDPKSGGIDQTYIELTYSILAASGVKTKFITFLDEGHVYIDAGNVQYAFEEALEWFRESVETP